MSPDTSHLGNDPETLVLLPGRATSGWIDIPAPVKNPVTPREIKNSLYEKKWCPFIFDCFTQEFCYQLYMLCHGTVHPFRFLLLIIVEK